MVILSNVENIDFGLNGNDKNKSKCTESDNDQDNNEPNSNERVNSICVDEDACGSSAPESDPDDPDYTDDENGSEAETKKRHHKTKTKRKGIAEFNNLSNTDDSESDDEDSNFENEDDEKDPNLNKKCQNKVKNEVSDYELRRKNNIAEFKNLYKQMFGETPGLSPEKESLKLNSWREESPEPKKWRRRASSINPEFKTSLRRRLSLPALVRRSARVSARYSRDKAGVFSWSSTQTPLEKLEILIQSRYNGNWPNNEKHSDSSCEEEDDENNFLGFREGFRGFKDIKPDQPSKKRKRATIGEWKPRVRAPRTIIPPEEITKSQIAKITYRSACKQYDNTNGTTCHQCRQKTIDTKTICRSPYCAGVRGQFCGFCLKTRYGEDAAEALKDPNWECPPCRNICNCSICRTRRGKIPTGILAPKAIEKGYDSVHHFLKMLKEDNPSEDEEL